MTGLTQVINNGWSGLNAASQALETVANNTANVNTAGYNVESVQQGEQPGVAGAPGNGTDVLSIQRAYDRFVFSQMVSATSANQAAQVTQNNAENLTAIFPVASGGSGGLSSTLTTFFSGMNQVSQDPTSIPNRQTFLSDANALAENFNSVGNQLASSLTSINGQLANAVTQVNTLVQEIANLNSQIEAQTVAGGQVPNASLDNRDNLVQQLGQEVGITFVPGTNNTVNVFTAGGAVLVDGATSANLVATSGTYGGNSVSIDYKPSGQDITANLSGGTIGGLIASRAQVVSAQNTVGALATAL
ncbi:MAG TPA: flagellar hook-associated protein FlgK, partial [Stellaceae bacterium]|nr:flagellar hook-associated protein FlgK [Stellaceae bacterium]